MASAGEAAMAYAELAAMTNFSFLRSAAHPEELVAGALAHGLAGLGIADRNSVAGIVRAHVAWRELTSEQPDVAQRLRVVSGCRLVLADGTPDLLVYPADRAAYGRLCRLLSLGKQRTVKGACRLTLDDVVAWCQGCQIVVLPLSTADDDGADPDTAPAGGERPLGPEALRPVLQRLAAAPCRGLWLGLRHDHGPDQRARRAALAALAAAHGLPLLAMGDVRMPDPSRKPLLDVLTCIRLGTTLEAAGTRLAAHAERHLVPPATFARLHRDHPEAVQETLRFLEGLRFSLDELRHDYPTEQQAGFADPQEALAAHARAGLRERYPDGAPPDVAATLEHELGIIASLDYAPYFLTVHRIVRFARARGILCQGRGSAANSVVCFALGITEVDPVRNALLFERFLSPERREPPDIDVDFEHERREEVIQFLYEHHGRERAGLAASVITYRARSAIRETARVFGLSEDLAGALSASIWGWSKAALDPAELRRLGLDPGEPRLALCLRLAQELIGFPRHLSQHTGGFVLTRTRLDEVCPIGPAAMEGRTTIEWDKDDLDALGLLKIDVLGLGMLSCLRRGLQLLAAHYGRALTLASIPAEDPAVYRMIQRADTIGVFQIESRAQMSMLPRLKPACFYDLVIEVAIVRPGPIQGDMVHPYLRRREGREPVVYPSPAPEHGPPDELEKVLGKTLGVPLFQEQAMRIAIVAAGFSAPEADRLRRAMATFRRVGTIGSFQRKMVEGMVRRGYDRAFAERCFRQIEGFGEYGFPESHAASFALLVYASCWLKCRYPDVFCAALLNAQPMGFYATAQIVRDAAEHGVPIRPVDVNASAWDATLEPAGERPTLHARCRAQAGDILSTHAVRLGLRAIKGLGEGDAQRLVAAREAGGPFDSLRDLWLRTGLPPASLARLAEADAFRSLGLDRREALWAVQGLRRAGDRDDLPLFAAATMPVSEPDAALPPMPLGQHVVEDYRHLSLSLKAHPAALVRPALDRRGIVPAGRLGTLPAGRRVTVAGLVLVRQRPGTAKGTIFMTLEDETGSANIIVWPKVFETFRLVVLGARFAAVTGRLQAEKGVVHVVSERIEDVTPMLAALLEPHSPAGAALGRAALAPADHAVRPLPRTEEGRTRPGKRARIAALLAETPELAQDLTPDLASLPGLARADEVRRPQRDARDRRGDAGAVDAVLPRGRNFH